MILAKQLFVGSIAYKCSGKDGNNNYTHVQTFSRDQSCTPASGQTISDDLVLCTGHGQYEVSELKVLAASGWDAGSGNICFLVTLKNPSDVFGVQTLVQRGKWPAYRMLKRRD